MHLSNIKNACFYVNNGVEVRIDSIDGNNLHMKAVFKKDKHFKCDILYPDDFISFKIVPTEVYDNEANAILKDIKESYGENIYKEMKKEYRREGIIAPKSKAKGTLFGFFSFLAGVAAVVILFEIFKSETYQNTIGTSMLFETSVTIAAFILSIVGMMKVFDKINKD